eukprot:COSAG03_NODE_160_length_11366_cov_10.057518_2_plen_76_part_00
MLMGSNCYFQCCPTPHTHRWHRSVVVVLDRAQCLPHPGIAANIFPCKYPAADVPFFESALAALLHSALLIFAMYL